MKLSESKWWIFGLHPWGWKSCVFKTHLHITSCVSRTLHISGFLFCPSYDIGWEEEMRSSGRDWVSYSTDKSLTLVAKGHLHSKTTWVKLTNLFSDRVNKSCVQILLCTNTWKREKGCFNACNNPWEKTKKEIKLWTNTSIKLKPPLHRDKKNKCRISWPWLHSENKASETVLKLFAVL